MLKQGAIEGAVEEVGILNDEFWILNGRGRSQAVPRLNPKLDLALANPEIDKLRWLTRWILFVPEQRRRCKRLEINDILFDLKTSARVWNHCSKLAILLAIFYNPVATHENA